MLKIYTRVGCPFCEKIKTFTNEAGIDFEEISINSEANSDELFNVGGKLQVPFLFDEEKDIKIYESSEIIDYLKDNYMQIN